MFRKRLLLIVSILMFTVAMTPVFAQETPPEEPDGPALPTSPEREAEIEAESQARYNDFLSRSITDFRVAYLIKQDAAVESSIFSASEVVSASGAIVISSWDEFLKLNAEQPFQIVLIHASMLDAVDVEWTQQAYRNGVILVGLNVDLPELVTLTADTCAGQEHTTNFVNQEFYVYLIYHVQILDAKSLNESEQAALVDEVHTAKLTTCVESLFPVVGEASVEVHHGIAASFVESSRELPFLFESLIVETMLYEMPVSAQLVPLPN